MRPTAPRRLPLVAEQSGWREYFYPETLEHADGVVQGTLRNLLGERDDERLAAAEYPLARYRAHQLRLDPALVPHTLDAAEVRAVHTWLFQDVYEWAGRYRVVDVAEEGSVFAPHGAGIDAVLTAMARHNARVPWERLDRDDTVTCAATTIALLNYAHPFREGNGRTTKAFLERLTALGRFTMRWSAVTPRQWGTACAHAMPAPGTMRTRPGELRPALEQIIQPRDATTSSTRASRIPTLVMPPPDQRRPGPTRGTPPAAGPPGPGARRTGRGPTL